MAKRDLGNDASPTSAKSLLESDFPALELSKVAAADRRSRDPLYSAHRWWARRPPAVMRAILLAAGLDGSTPASVFWNLYRDSNDALVGLRVHDPFMGGGSTLIEAARLGATVGGSDVDATAVAIVRHCLEPADAEAVREAGADMLAFLRTHLSELWGGTHSDSLHYFHLPIVTCPQCERPGTLYRSLVLARDCGKPGAVVRDVGTVAFDPETFELVQLESGTAKQFKGATRRWRLDYATYSSSRYTCPSCGHRSTHRELQTGAAPTRLVAVECAPSDSRRVVRTPTTAELEQLIAAREMLDHPPVPLRLPDCEFAVNRSDPRPRSFGITRVRDLFTPRQLLALGAAHAWVDNQVMDEDVRRGLKLALSNALATNNRLCSYATDYGRLSALFSVRGYSLPALVVEMNPLHPNAGRGTLQQCVNRVADSARGAARRAYWDTKAKAARSAEYAFVTLTGSADLACASAADSEVMEPVDLLIFDPPYYDYIDYDELAELFRAWNPDMGLGGIPLQTMVGEDITDFGVALAECLRPALTVRRPGRPIAFTYHSSNSAAWEAIGAALDEAKLRVTAMWPVRSDGHMGHHSHPGNCEWDVVVVCRPVDETTELQVPAAMFNWRTHFGDFTVGDSDLVNFKLAQQIAMTRFGQPTD